MKSIILSLYYEEDLLIEIKKGRLVKEEVIKNQLPDLIQKVPHHHNGDTAPRVIIQEPTKTQRIGRAKKA